LSFPELVNFGQYFRNHRPMLMRINEVFFRKKHKKQVKGS